MRYFDAFAGIGGLPLGIQQAYEDYIKCKHISTKSEKEECEQRRVRFANEPNKMLRTSDGTTPLCVGYSEINKYAIKVYEKHFPNHRNYGDATKIDPKQLPDFDLLVGGFPCQSFSVAGKRRGFDDTRGTLFFDIARILAEKRSRLVVLENVKGLLSHDEGKTFQTILGVLSDLGYVVEWQVLNSKNFGVPQNRERVFIIGYFGGIGGRKIFPIGESNKQTYSYIKIAGSTNNSGRGERARIFDPRGGVSALTATDYKQPKQIKVGLKQVVGGPQGNRVYDPSGISTTIASESGGLGAKTGLYAVPVLTPDRLKKRQDGRRFKENNDPAFTVTAQDKHGIFDGCRIRRLTPTECMRLQGFPDDWCDVGSDGVKISDTQKYKMAGNAVTVNVIKAIFERLMYFNK